ncbi:acetylxylan esterase [Crossiella sp. CA-258035]|uniref:poly(ethylene terephthalate) hydrolase family protein n=1 Tax=Crossiella sp. CA-258035 TaxID=2981138 RepID=UPI0024BC46EC|nr:acetylxylan esterase [Crossiella sp. CA-258035]WHT16322.1 acetylxylan esterase [Crossiella sp. CA-258035]
MAYRSRRMAGLAFITTALLLTPVQAAAAPPSHFEAPGPHAVTKVRGGPDHTLYYPSDLGSGGIQHPVLVWGNGTGVSPEPYDAQLRHLASWGFVVAAANTTQAGSGREMLDGARFLIAEDSRPGSVFHGKIDETKVGAAGHSQGGGGAIAAGADPLVDTTVPLMPGPQGSVPALNGPSLFLAGQLDLIVPSVYVRGRYSWAGHVPAVFAELKGADHFFPGDTRIRAAGVMTAWFRHWLSGDANAREIFFGADCLLCQDKSWSAVARNEKARQVRD